MTDLRWPGLTNARDLGGLPTASGTTRHGAFVRSDDPNRLTAAGWEEVANYGIRRIVSLTTTGLTPEEDKNENARLAPRPGFDHVDVWVEDGSHAEFKERFVATSIYATPLYYPQALRWWPQQFAVVLDALAGRSAPVLYHCAGGFDRTGLVTLLLLHNAGVDTDAIVADYMTSFANLQVSNPTEFDVRKKLLQREGATAQDSVAATIASLDKVFWATAAVAPDTRRALRDALAPTP